MKKYRFFALLLAALLTLPLVLPARALEDPMPNCGAAIVVDGDHGEVLYSHNGYEKMYPASITKIMTSLVVLDAVDNGELALDTPITASAQAVQIPYNSSTAGLKAGEILTVEQLLYCDLVPSANEACNILAEAVAGTVEDFVARMNEKARELGMTGTHFVNPHGIHHDDHYTTAYDIYLMSAAAMEHEVFRTIVSTAVFTLPPTNLVNKERTYYNTNGLLSNWYVAGYMYPDAIGIKTGTTDEAGRCLSAAAVDEQGRTFYTVILGAKNDYNEDGKFIWYSYHEAKRLLQWGFSNFQRTTLLDPSTDHAIREVDVTLSDEADYVLAQPVGSITATMPTDYDPALAELIVELPDSVEAPVEAGRELGTISIVYDGVNYGTLPMVAVDSVSRSEFQYNVRLIQSYWAKWWVKGLAILAVVVIVLFIFWLAVIRRSRKQRRRYSYSGGRRGGSYRGRRR